MAEENTEMELNAQTETPDELNIEDIESQLAAAYERMNSERNLGTEQVPDELHPEEEIEPTSDEPTSTEPTEPVIEQPTEAQTFKIANQELKEEELTEAVGLLNWARGLSQTQIDAIRGITVGQIAQPQPEPTQSTQKEEYLDPRAAEEIAALREELTALKQPVLSMQERAQLEQQQLVNSQIDLAKKTFSEEYELTPLEIKDLEDRLLQKGIYPSLVQSTGDYYKAALEGFKTTYFSNEENLQREVTRRLEKERAENSQNRERKLKAASLSGKSGSVSRAPADPANSEERREAMVAELAAHMNQ